jgi:hypothetical protein
MMTPPYANRCNIFLEIKTAEVGNSDSTLFAGRQTSTTTLMRQNHIPSTLSMAICLELSDGMK